MMRPAHIAYATSSPAASGQGALVQRKCACGGTPGPTGTCAECRRTKKTGLQPKLRVSQPGDRYEREADHLADRVMRMTDARSPALPISHRLRPGDVPRQPAEEEEEEMIQPRAAEGSTAEVSPAVADGIAGLRGGGRPLDDGTRSFMESRFGYDFGRVRIHTSERAAGAAHAIRAHAFTAGTDIAFARGAYDPHSGAGLRLLAHELTHVLQQVPQVQRTAAAPAVQRAAPGLVQRADDPEDEAAPEKQVPVGVWQIFDAQGERAIDDLPLNEYPSKAPPPGIHAGKISHTSGSSFVLKTKSIPGGKYKFTVTAKKESDRQHAVAKLKTAAQVQLVVTHGAQVLGGKKDQEAPPGAGVPSEKPGEGEGVKPPPTPEPGGTQTVPAPEGDQDGGGTPGGSKYGWLGLLDFLPPEVIAVLEAAFEALVNTEEYLALKEFIQTLMELQPHLDSVETLFSDAGVLLEVVLAVEDASLTPAADALGGWVQRGQDGEKKKKKPGGKRSKGIARLAAKVVGILGKVRRLLGPVFATRAGFQQVIELATLALAVPGIEDLFEEIEEAESVSDALREKVRGMAGEVVQTVLKKMDEVQALLAIPKEGIDPSDLITSEELATAVTRAAVEFVPKQYKPIVWGAEKLGLVDLVGEHLVSELVPQGALDGLNEKLAAALSEDVIGPVAGTAATELATFVKEIKTPLKETVEEVLDEVLLQRSPADGGAVEADEQAVRARMRHSRGTPLPDGLRQPMEQAMGADFSQVAVHTDGPAREASHLIHARAFTDGRDLYFGAGQYRPETPEGRHLLAHELAHVAGGDGHGPLYRAVDTEALIDKYLAKVRAKVKTGATTAFSPSPATEAAAKKVREKVIKLIGRPIDQVKGQIPKEAYVIAYKGGKPKKPGGKPPTVKSIRRRTKFLLYVPPLTIKGGRLELNLNRGIDPKAAARRKLRGSMGCAKDEQAHHVIPLQLESHPIADVAVTKGKWNFNGPDNGRCLGIDYHYGSHGGYTAMVQGRLDAIDQAVNGSRDWSVIKPKFTSLVAELKKGLDARTYKLRK